MHAISADEDVAVNPLAAFKLHLDTLGVLFDADASFLNEHNMVHAIRHRALHIDQRRTPMITAHFDPADKTFTLTFMKDSSHQTCATAEEAAQAIGAHVYDLQRQK